MKKKLAVLLSAATALSLVLSACGGNSGSGTTSATQAGGTEATTAATAAETSAVAQPAPSSGEKVTITMSNWLEAEEATAGIFKEMLDDFMAENPDIIVESTAIPFTQYKDQVLIAGASGNPADVIMGNSTMMPAFQGAGILAQLDGLVSQEVIDDIYPGYLAGTTYNGKVMALSWAPHPIAMYYNKELFEKAGLDPETPPTTWDEMTEAGRAIAALGQDEDGNILYGLGFSTGKIAQTGTLTNGVLYAFGGQFLDDDGNVSIVNDANVEALAWLKQITDDGINPAGLEIAELRGLFATGQIGILFDGDMGRNTFRESSGLGTAFDEKMGVAIVPAGKTGRSETIYTEHQIGIAEKSEHKEAAAKLVEYLLGKEAMTKYHKSNAIISARESIATLSEMNEDYFMEVFNKQSETASPLPATNAMFDNAMNEMNKGIERIIINNEDIETVLKETEDIIKGLYGN